MDPDDEEFKEIVKMLGKVGIVHGSSHPLQGPERPVQGRLRPRIRHSQIKACMHHGSA